MHQLPVEPDDVDQQPLDQAVLAHDAHGQQPALLGQLEVTVFVDVQQAVAFHAGDGLADGGTGLVQPLGDARAERDDAFLFELEDRLEVHLCRIDEVAHPTALLASLRFPWRCGW